MIDWNDGPPNYAQHFADRCRSVGIGFTVFEDGTVLCLQRAYGEDLPEPSGPESDILFGSEAACKWLEWYIQKWEIFRLE